jgi:hypothetical protein
VEGARRACKVWGLGAEPASPLRPPFPQPFKQPSRPHATPQNPTAAEAKLLLLIRKASTQDELDAAWRLTKVNRARATRLGQYHPYSNYLPNALLQAGQRVGAPAAFYARLLEHAPALGMPVSCNLAEAALQACGADGGAFDAAWVHAQVLVPGGASKRMVAFAMRSLAARGRPADAVWVADQFTGGGGELAPSVAKLRDELERQAAGQGEGGQAEQAVEVEGKEAGESEAEKKAE